MTKNTTLRAIAAFMLVFAVACADAGTEGDAAEGSGDNTILPAGDPTVDQTGGVGDMGTGTGTSAPGSNEPAQSVGPDTTTGDDNTP